MLRLNSSNARDKISIAYIVLLNLELSARWPDFVGPYEALENPIISFGHRPWEKLLNALLIFHTNMNVFEFLRCRDIARLGSVLTDLAPHNVKHSLLYDNHLPLLGKPVAGFLQHGVPPIQIATVE